MPGSIGLILLAAGQSSRMSQPKQLLIYEGQTLLRRALEAAAGSSCHPIAVVVGSEPDAMIPELDTTGLPQDAQVEIVFNLNWECGMGTSIRAGLQALQHRTELDAVIVTLCDQPMVTSALIETIIAAYREADDCVVASEYGTGSIDSGVGVPALFDSSLFPELLAIHPDEGAKRIILKHEDRLGRVLFPGGLVDIDTPADYNTLLTAPQHPGFGDEDTLGSAALTSEEQAISGEGPPEYEATGDTI